MRKYRVFFAILPPQNSLAKISKVIEDLKKMNIPVRWEDPQKVHLTVVFMGLMSQNKIEEAGKVASQVAQNHNKFRLSLGGVNYLYKKHADSIIYIEAHDPDGSYLKFHKDFCRTLLGNGLLPSTRPTLHLTIGRLKRINPPNLKKEILAKIASRDEGIYENFEVGEFHLLESTYEPSANTTRYRLMKTFPLQDKLSG